MSERRVVVTGLGGVTALGASWKELGDALRSGRSGVAICDELVAFEGIQTPWAGRIDGPEWPAWPRRKTRGMGRVARLAALASDLAIERAGLTGSPLLSDGSTGLAHGCTAGSPQEMALYTEKIVLERTLKGVVPIQYVRGMSHTTAANLAPLYGIRGGLHATCSACTSGSQAIGVGYEQIRFGRQERMVCGGAEEWHVSETAVFDMLFATSTRTDDATPRPFDEERDGLVVSEGAATLVLEEREAALARGAEILAEVIGYGTTCDGDQIMAPNAAGMEAAMRRALEDAGIAGPDVDYLSAHATATEIGDIAESQASLAVYGRAVPTSSLKGHLGHTLGACGAVEAWATIEMLREGWVAPTLHLERVDPRCAELDYVMGAPRRLDAEIAVSNNFAFGGVNTSLVLRIGDAG